MAIEKRFTSREAWRQVAYSLAMMSIFAPAHSAWRGTVMVMAVLMVAVGVAWLVRARCVG